MSTPALLAMIAVTGIAIVASVVLVMSWMGSSAYGENYQYNMTKSEMQDEVITEACARLQINSEQCDMVYGGILNHASDGKIN